MRARRINGTPRPPARLARGQRVAALIDGEGFGFEVRPGDVGEVVEHLEGGLVAVRFAGAPRWVYLHREQVEVRA